MKKAIEIANNLLQAGYTESQAEVIAFSNAKFWPSLLSSDQGHKTLKTHLHLVPHPKGWAVIPTDASSFHLVYSSKNDALCKARLIAKNEKIKLYIHSLAGNISDSESFAVNRPYSSPEIKEAPSAYSVSFSNDEKPTHSAFKREAVRRAKLLATKVRTNFWVGENNGENSENALSFDM